MATAYDAGLIERVMPRIKQWESTTGRRIQPSVLDALIKGELEAEAGKANQSRALDLQERGIANAEQATKDAKSAAKVKGVADIASTAGMGYLTYKSLTKPSPMSELIAYQKSITAPGTTAPAIAPATTGGDALLTGGSATTQGAQTALAGGAMPTGAQVIPAVGSAPELAATTGQAAWVEPAAGGAESMLATAAPYVSAAGVALAGRPVGKMIANALGTHEKTTQDITEAAAYAGAGFLVAGPVGAVVGGVLGIVKGVTDSVICGELVRQGELSERDRTKCIVFRFRVIPDPLFHAYLKWSAPIVAIMKRGGALNALLVPFAKAFVGYMIALQTGKIPTFAERIAWKYAWWRCSKIAQRNEQSVMEVA